MPNQTDPPAPETREHHPILDALRFCLAFWVVMSHGAIFPLFAGMDESTRLGWIFVRGWNSVVFGVPAVIGFFIISGFCIHLPYRQDRPLAVGRYYARRYIRILLPVFGYVILYRHLGNSQPLLGAHSILYEGVLWSLLCEEVYYAVYPLTRWVRKTAGWSVLLPSAFAVGALTAAANFHEVNWTTVNPLAMAVILFPVWLLGCLLAEQSGRLPAIQSSRTIWKWRLFAWAASWVCGVLHYQLGLHLIQTMPWFGVIAYFWIKREIAYGASRSPAAVLVSAGAWSYSLYLVHAPTMILFSRLKLPSFGYLVDWFLLIGFVLGMAYLYYILIERPAHRLARMAGSARRIKTAPFPVPSALTTSSD